MTDSFKSAGSWQVVTGRPVASERNQHCGGEARPKGPKLEAQRAIIQGSGFMERGLPPLPSPHQLGGFRERFELPQWGPGQSPAAKNFGAFWVSLFR